MNVTGFRCRVCAATLGVEAALPWRCPRSTAADRHHVLDLVRSSAPLQSSGDPHPFVGYDAELAWAAFADARGMDLETRVALVTELDAAVALVAGTGFVITPFERSAALSDELGFAADGGVWVKDETHQVAGSHKARHLFTILLHLRAAEMLGLAPWSTLESRPALAIASCGNAALAASTLARGAGWPIEVFVPEWADDVVIDRLVALGASINRCSRRAGDPPGDPTIHRFREAVGGGAIPFSVQGPENTLCLDGGRTIGWEMHAVLGRALDRLFVQVGGGAFASCVGASYRGTGVQPMLHAVQAEGCAPLARAWDSARGTAHPERHWAELMTPWDDPRSLADGILDDETYDWLGVMEAMRARGGWPVVAPEAQIVAAHRLSLRTGIDASPTGTAGLAGLLTIRGEIADDERVAVVFSGVRR